jgi:hypothetical protein
VVPFYQNNYIYGKEYEHLGHLEEANRRLHSEPETIPVHPYKQDSFPRGNISKKVSHESFYQFWGYQVSKKKENELIIGL